MKIKTTLIATLLATTFGTASAATIETYASDVNGSIRHMDTTPAGDVNVIMHIKTRYEVGNKTKKYNKTLQFTGESSYFDDLIPQLGYGVGSIESQELSVNVRATGGRELAESFELPFELSNETYKHAKDASVGHAAIFNEKFIDSNGNKYDVPVVYVNINGRYVPAKPSNKVDLSAKLDVPGFIKGNGKHLFKAVPTDILDNVIVGYIEAKEHINFNKESYYFADGERIPVYWTMKRENDSSCNDACKNQRQAHMTVSEAKVLGSFKKRSDIKASDENGELLDWIQFHEDDNGTLRGLGDRPFGIVRDAMLDKTYWVYGSAIAKDTSEASTTESAYYSKDKNASPAMAIRLDLN
ncbi:hypothetical protein [Vibrio maerlii]|uniref:hypothetical protein n=1 Tax=Vibrio maerlii TaxID=2231648 RepID=UPI000E3DFF42|nr:hypothetical protein [Vibrio maerlii]